MKIAPQIMKRKTINNNQFDIFNSISGLAYMLNIFYDQLNVFKYHITFKKELKEYGAIFRHPCDQPLDIEFFDSIDDPLVVSCTRVASLISNCMERYNIRYGLTEDDIFTEEAIMEFERYKPSRLPSLNRKSYVFMGLTYERYLEAMCNSLYHYSCVLTLQHHNIPVAMRVNIEYSDMGSFRLLNVEDDDVVELVELISALQEERVRVFG